MPIIRKERPEDIAAIRRVNELAFGSPAEADLVDALRNSGKAVFSLVAVAGEQIAGHILFSPVRIEPEADPLSAIGLAPMAVLPELQNQGIGTQLVKAGLDECRKAGYDCVVVLGHPNFYPRFGFAPASRFNLKCEYDVRDEVFMAMELREGSLSGRAGLVKYESEFAEA